LISSSTPCNRSAPCRTRVIPNELMLLGNSRQATNDSE
jgi:hypothetical protein